MRKLLKRSLKAGRSVAHKLRSAAHAMRMGYSSGQEAKAFLASMRAQNERLMKLVSSKLSRLPFASKKEVSALRAKVAKLEKRGKRKG